MGSDMSRLSKDEYRALDHDALDCALMKHKDKRGRYKSDTLGGISAIRGLSPTMQIHNQMSIEDAEAFLKFVIDNGLKTLTKSPFSNYEVEIGKMIIQKRDHMYSVKHPYDEKQNGVDLEKLYEYVRDTIYGG